MSDNAFAGWGGNRPTNGDNEITFTNVRILDATGDAPYAGEVTVEGNRIKRVARQGGGYSWGMTGGHRIDGRSEEHTSELQSLMRISYAVFCLKKNKTTHEKHTHAHTRKN